MVLPTLFFVERGNMFNFFNKNKNSDGVMMSPVNGLCIDLSEVPDKVFSERMIGDGVAFIYEDDMISVSYTHLDVYKRQDLFCVQQPRLYKRGGL